MAPDAAGEPTRAAANDAAEGAHEGAAHADTNAHTNAGANAGADAGANSGAKIDPDPAANVAANTAVNAAPGAAPTAAPTTAAAPANPVSAAAREDDRDHAPRVDGALLRRAAEALLDGTPFFGLVAASAPVRRLLLDAIETIALPEPVAAQLGTMRAERAPLFDHSLRMAVLCAHLAREGGLPQHEISAHAAAGLLHDLGMLQLDGSLLAAGTPLSGDERRPLYTHPVTASMLLAQFNVYPRTVARAVLEHHERLDGSGYPRMLKGDAISPMGRVLSIAEVVTAMFDGQRRFPAQRVALLLRLAPRRFDASLVRSIQRLLRALPASGDVPDLPLDAALDQLRARAALVAQWPAVLQASAAALPASRAESLAVIGEQLHTLQIMLNEAGATVEQLETLAGEALDEIALRIELWVLEQELHWHLRVQAYQVQRSLRDIGTGMPAPMQDWLERALAPASR